MREKSLKDLNLDLPSKILFKIFLKKSIALGFCSLFIIIQKFQYVPSHDLCSLVTERTAYHAVYFTLTKKSFICNQLFSFGMKDKS